MKRNLFHLTVLAALVGASMVRAEMTYVATIFDVRKEETFQVMSRDELKTLKQTIDAEAHVFQKAIEATKKEWDAAEKAAPAAAAAKPAAGKAGAVTPIVRTGPRPFPGGMLAPRKVTEAGPFERAQAEKKVQSLEDAQVNALSKSSTKTTTKKTDQEKKREELRKVREAEQTQAAQEAALKLQAKIDELVKAAANPTAADAAGDDKTVAKAGNAATPQAAAKAGDAADKTKAAAK